MKKSLEVETGFKAFHKSGLVWCGKDAGSITQQDLDYHFQLWGLKFGKDAINVDEDGKLIGTARKVSGHNVYVITLN